MPDEDSQPSQAAKKTVSNTESDLTNNKAKEDKPGKPRASRTPAPDRPFPRKTLEDALRVPTAIKSHNGGRPYNPSEVAKALGIGTGGNFFYLTSASRSFGLTEGTRDAQVISLTDLGRQAVYPGSDNDRSEAMLSAFFSVNLFKRIVEHYGGSQLPSNEFVRNTLEKEYGLAPEVHEEFLDLFEKNCRFVGIGADFNGSPQVNTSTSTTPRATTVEGTQNSDDSPSSEKPVCFVAMPFGEKTDQYAIGFFEEVYVSLLRPAIHAAGFEARTASKQGSDLIHATIINDLLDAHLVLVDLTEHNPNVLFELGVRLAKELPTVLVRAKGTDPIFDVDNLLRVESYNPNLWASTIEKDLPKIVSHIEAQWNRRENGPTYMSLLRRE